MSFKVKVNMKSTSKILKDKGLNEGGEIQKYFTKQFAKEMNNYVPYTTGRLKDDSVTIKDTCIIYGNEDVKYAKKQYYQNVKGGEKNRTGLRGKLWDKRCWQDKGTVILKRILKFLKNRSVEE